MFATLSSFLPSALQQGSPNPANAPAKDPPPLADVEVAKPKEAVVDEGSTRRKEKRTNHEVRLDHTGSLSLLISIYAQSFIVVRPPPAKSNHPLNLQVQLVPPQSRDRERTRSMDISQPSQDQEDTILTRTSSNRSDVSMYSAGYSSVTSFASVSSSSTTSSRRMIIPLYNLQAHNVMTNVIVDAGTDAKVAKFQKRGLEILGLAVLEPVEVFSYNNSLVPQIPPSSNRTSIDDHQDSPLASPFTPRPGGADGVYTPTSSAHSLSSGGMDNPSPSPPLTRPDLDSTPTSGTKKIFGKFFKKKDNQPSSPSPSSPIGNFIPRPSRLSTGQSLAIPSQGNAKRNSWLGPTNSGQQSELSTSPPASIPTSSHLQPAILGIHPSCSSPKYPPQGRPHSYTWVVRKWIKGSNGGLLGNVMGHMNQLSLSDERRRTPPEEGAVEVHFVWSRGKKKRKVPRDGNQPAGANRRPTGGPPDKRGSASSPNRSGTTDLTEKRLSAVSGQSVSTASEVGSSAGRHTRGEDDGNESDPEDSETPWTCTLVLSRVGDGGSGAMTPAAAAAAAAADGISGGGSSSSNPTRVRVATFSPTPHHPKVVALLKVPFPLPDIIVDRVQVCRRAVNSQGIARPSWSSTANGGGGSSEGDEPDGLVLTAEEIKDVVSSTGLWLVVRENIGGVGKISRKGDGWRIRA